MYIILTSKKIDAKDLIYKVRRILEVVYKLLKEFIINKNKLFILSF